MANLSSAIIEARKRHEAEIAERLKRRQMRQRAEVERLNATAAGEPVPSEPTDLATPTVPEPGAPRAVEVQAPAPRDEPAPLPPPPAPTPAPPVRRHEPRLTKPVAAPHLDEVETLPDGRFLRVRNDIIDRIKPFLTGNQFAVYLEIYRQTVGRGKTSGWFRTRDIQTACNLGSDNTVRDAYPVLEQKRLIRLDPNRRIGSPKGLHVTVLSVDRALDRLERSQTPAAAPIRAARPAHVVPETDERADSDSDDAGDLVQTIIRKYGVSPTGAPQLVDLVADVDRPLLPYLFARLDRSIAAGKVHNPAGLLRVWLESFESWRPELVADRDREDEARRRSRDAATRDERMVEWFKETEARVQELYDALDPAERVRIEARGRDELLSRSAAVRTWTDEQWAGQLATFVKSELRKTLDGFDAWMRANGYA